MINNNNVDNVKFTAMTTLTTICQRSSLGRRPRFFPTVTNHHSTQTNLSHPVLTMPNALYTAAVWRWRRMTLTLLWEVLAVLRAAAIKGSAVSFSRALVMSGSLFVTRREALDPSIGAIAGLRKNDLLLKCQEREIEVPAKVTNAMLENLLCEYYPMKTKTVNAPRPRQPPPEHQENLNKLIKMLAKVSTKGLTTEEILEMATTMMEGKTMPAGPSGTTPKARAKTKQSKPTPSSSSASLEPTRQGRFNAWELLSRETPVEMTSEAEEAEVVSSEELIEDEREKIEQDVNQVFTAAKDMIETWTPLEKAKMLQALTTEKQLSQ